MWLETTRVRHLGSLLCNDFGPVTVAAERGGLLIRWLAPTAGSNPAWSSNSKCCVAARWYPCRDCGTQLRVCTPIGRGSALRAHSVAVRAGPDAPTCIGLCSGWRLALMRNATCANQQTRAPPVHQKGMRSRALGVSSKEPISCSVTHLVRRPDCPSGERDSISLRSANRPAVAAAMLISQLSLQPLSCSYA
jgi:hypothetical protein